MENSVNPNARAKDLGARASRPYNLPHKQWHSRGYLPHFDQPGRLQSLTFRLYDSLPHEVVERWKQELSWHETLSAEDPIAVELRQRIARFEDEGHGRCWLARVDIAHLVEDALLHFDGERYHVLAWCVMPNHVHIVIETQEGNRVGDIVHSWKSFTAKEANKRLIRRGSFWMPDYYDRFIRDANHLDTVVAYVENNPVKAGLVRQATGWKFSSVSHSVSISKVDGAGGTPALPGSEGTSWHSCCVVKST